MAKPDWGVLQQRFQSNRQDVLPVTERIETVTKQQVGLLVYVSEQCLK